MKIDTVLLVMASAFIASVVVAREPRQQNVCEALKTFAAAERENGGGQVELKRQGRWLVDHVKSCVREDDDQAAKGFCTYLVEQTSTEFLEATINQAMACLQGQRIKGYLGNTGISEWDGKIRFYSPNLDIEDIEIEMQWHMTAGFGAWDDFLRITVSRSR
jgi:hypothetical protein